jgi:cytoplasmic iron level regulating protein YaaA (DUF328/UPF0246 family)
MTTRKKKARVQSPETMARVVQLLDKISRILGNMAFRDVVQAFELDQIRKRLAHLEHAQVRELVRRKTKKQRRAR